MEKPGIEPATPGLQDIGLRMIHLTDFDFHCTFKHFKYIMNLQIYELTFIDVYFFLKKKKTHLHFAGISFIIMRKYNLILYKYISFHDNMKINKMQNFVYF